ncbi:Lrp/AsnC family transcriptional regulator [Paenibacillus radicis (ex Xue et al. 2023)]|uniref:AsnC family transcriptional regulator n=1 Tax=Paenibacillus radicis (ex Xue et al. 2023) TaxID=2972489 RepID=A0ABT1YGN3_9BACL|nr:AsnC family transcriptional regulator [Paenibacillus radicis (ex Xue et al. 2023)]MCR8631559.1 AsnC family transcriptional regulator [Paenibacillus radicis (ex Xue et al. 2023)]
MDKIDSQILALLHENARMPVAEIGRTIAMTQPAVTERMRKLEEQGIIEGYKAILSSKKLGKDVTAFVLFKTSNCLDFQGFCMQSSDVIELYRISGEYNFMMKIITASMESLATFLDSCSPHGFSSTLIVLSAAIENKRMVADNVD